MDEIIAILERARGMELEVTAQLEHIERLHRIVKRSQASHAYAQKNINKLAALEKRLNDTIDEMCDAKSQALDYISLLTGEERSVIEGYYILGKSWDKLAGDLYTSERRVYILRKSALNKILQNRPKEPLIKSRPTDTPSVTARRTSQRQSHTGFNQRI